MSKSRYKSPSPTTTTSDNALAEQYKAYIAELNGLDVEVSTYDLSAFVADHVVHNGVTLTQQQYADMIAVNMRKATWLRPTNMFDVRMLVADESKRTVASRIRFRCLLVGSHCDEFSGVGVPGNWNGCVEFCEHVFYRFEGEGVGRIVEVWSLVDIAGLRKQIEDDM